MKVRIAHSSSLIPLAFLVLLLGFALRITLIEKRPLHFDEGINVYFAPLALPELLQAHIANADTDPPAHRITLGGWAGGAGLSPFSIRLYSVFFSTLSIALLYRVARQLKLPYSACLSAVVLMALSPYAIDYAQEAKGYAMGAALALVSWWAWMQVRGTRDEGRVSIIYAASTALMLGTHFYTAPVLLMQWVWWFFAYKQPTLKAVVGRLVLQIAACVPVGIWVVMALPAIVAGSLGMSSGGQPLPLLALLQLILGEMSVSRAASEPLNLIGAVVFGVLLLLGAFSLWRHNRRAFWFGAVLLVPLVFTAVLQLRISFFKPRFLLYALPNLLVLVSGLTLRPRIHKPGFFKKPGLWMRSVVAFVAFVVGIAGLIAFYQSPIDTANDFRPLIARLRPLVQTHDGALGTYIWMRGMVTSYAPDAAQKLGWHVDFVNEQNMNEAMPPIVAAHARLWSFNFVRNPDAPDATAVQWLRGQWAYADRLTAGNLSVLLFAKPSLLNLSNVQPIIFDNRISLRGQVSCPKDLAGLNTASQTPTSSNLPGLATSCVARIGDALMLIAEWTALTPITDDLSISLQLVRPDGQLAAQNDSAAVNGLAPSFTWKENQPVLDPRAVLIPSNLSAGRYTLRLGIYRRSDGARLKTETGAEFVNVSILEIR